MSEASRRQRKQDRARLLKDRANYDKASASLGAAIRKGDERFERCIGRPFPANIKPCPEPGSLGFEALSRAAMATLAAVFRQAILGRRDSKRE